MERINAVPCYPRAPTHPIHPTMTHDQLDPPGHQSKSSMQSVPEKHLRAQQGRGIVSACAERACSLTTGAANAPETPDSGHS